MGYVLSKHKACASVATAPARKSLEDFPDELLEVILREACTDGGRAACALSLVSRRIRDVGAPFRYHNIALSGEAQLWAFRDHVDVLRAHGSSIPEVKALFLQCLRHGASSHTYLRTPAKTKFDTTGLVLRSRPTSHGASSRLARPTLRPLTAVNEDESFEQMYEWALPIVSLLSVLAPTLQSLALVIDCPRVTTLVPVAFPLLEELTCLFLTNPIPIRGYAMCQPQNRLDIDLKVPALRRLHLVDSTFSVRLGALRELPPTLTHLRLTGVTSTELEKSLTWLSTPGRGHPMPELWLPRGLHRILFSPRESPGIPLKWLRAAKSGVDITEYVAIVQEATPYGARQIYDHWLGRLDGRDGSWVAGKALADFAQISEYGMA
jgi:hypothetical protein